jgi:tetratricopeptide (TPR) repeat protein
LYNQDDLVKCLDNRHKAASLNRGSYLPRIYSQIGLSYATAGFREKSIHYITEALKLDDDSAAYYGNLANVEDCYGNYELGLEYGKKSYSIDSTDDWVIYFLGVHHLYLGQNEKSLEYFKTYERIYKAFPIFKSYNIGYAYLANGFKEEAEYYFNQGQERLYRLIELDRPLAQNFHIYFLLASIHCIMGEDELAYKNLRILNRRQRMPFWIIANLKNEPHFQSIRDEPEFQQIVKDVEVKYQAEHERVRKWLEENDML